MGKFSYTGKRVYAVMVSVGGRSFRNHGTAFDTHEAALAFVDYLYETGELTEGDQHAIDQLEIVEQN